MPPETDDPTPKPDQKPNDRPPPSGDPTPEPLGDKGIRALQAERDRAKAAEERAKAAEAKIAEAERAKLGETERLALERDEHKTGREKAESKLLRYEVAMEKGLTAAQAKRLSGGTREELEADADELIEMFGGKAAPPPPGKPRENLRGGGDPTDEPEETDPAKLAALIPRS